MKQLMAILSCCLLLMGILLVEAQGECTPNLTQEDCEIYETALENLRTDETLNFQLLLQIQLVENVTQSRYLTIGGDASLFRNDNGDVARFLFDSSIRANTGDDFAMAAENYQGFWQFSYDSENLYYAQELENWNRMTLSDNLLPLESIFPALFQDFEIENLYAETGSFAESTLMLYDFSIDSSIVDGPFAGWRNAILGEEVEQLTGTANYMGRLAIQPDAKRLQAIRFRGTEFLDGEAFGSEVPLLLRIDYTLRFYGSSNVIEEFEIDFENVEDADSEFGEAAESGMLGLLAAALPEPIGEIFPPISD